MRNRWVAGWLVGCGLAGVGVAHAQYTTTTQGRAASSQEAYAHAAAGNRSFQQAQLNASAESSRNAGVQTASQDFAPRYTQSSAVKQIKVALTNSQGQPAGTAILKQKKNGVEIKLSLQNVPFGPHGVHIHQNAVCEAPDFKSAGPHFNPENAQHGFENPMGHHAGDTPSNIQVGEDHTGSQTWTLTSVSLQPGAPNSLLTNNGTSIMVHEHADDMKSDPSGNSGNRIACGVIKLPS